MTQTTVDSNYCGSHRWPLSAVIKTAERLVCSLTFESSCGACNGTGSIETTRTRHLDELTDKQSKALYHADLERTKAIEGVENEDEVQDKMPNVPQSNNLSGSAPNPGDMSVPNNPRP